MANEITNEIKKQLEFVEWLKSKGIYDPLDTALTMRKMQAVWEKLR